MKSRHSNSHDEPLASSHLDAAVDPDEGDLLLRVTGYVPATDFHPVVVAAAQKLRVRGWVQSEAGGALIRAIGSETQLVSLVRAIRRAQPTSASIRSLDTEPIEATTLSVGDRFVALVAETVALPDPTPSAPLANVA